MGSIEHRLMHTSTSRQSASIFVTATKRPAPVRRTSSCRRARDQGDNYLCAVPMLTRSNYNEWALLMRQPTSTRVLAHHRDRGRRSDRVLGGSTGVRNHTVGCAYGDVGVSLHQTHHAIGLGGDQIPLGWCAATVEVQCRAATKEFPEILFKDSESVDNFFMQITGLANNITTLDGCINETEIVKKMLQVAPDHREQLAILIETLLNMNDPMMEEVTRRLHNVEQRKKNTTSAIEK